MSDIVSRNFDLLIERTKTVAETQKEAIEAAIAECDGSINRAAKRLQVAPSTIYRKIQSWKTSP